MKLKNAKLKSSLKANFSHFESEDGRKFNKVKTSIDAYGPGDSWEECNCYLEIVNGEMFCYLAESHLEDYFDDFNWKKGFDDMLSDRLSDAKKAQSFIDKGEKIPHYIYGEVYDRGMGVEVVAILSKAKEDTQTEDVRTEPIIGKFKPKRKFLNFISSVNGARVRFIRDVAFIKGEKLSGVLEGVIFKVTICDEGTINFEEQKGSSLSDESMIKRLIADIDEKDVAGYAQKFVVAGLEFNDINSDRCYLEVEHEKPINKLKSLFDEEDEKVEVSQKSLSLLDDLFGSSDDEEVEEELNLSEEDVKTIVEANENPSEPVEKLKNAAESYMEEQFRKMNESKIVELEYRIEETQREIIRYKNEAKQAEKKAEEKVEALGVLETRLETMKPGDEPNGYVFFVSEEQKDMEELDENEAKVADKIADIMKLKKDVLMKMLTEGYYKIKIAKADDITNQDFELDKEVYNKIMTLDIDGKMLLTDSEFQYRGKLNWHQLVAKMIKSGFSQDEEFDKLCNSNSYESKEEDKEKDIEE